MTTRFEKTSLPAWYPNKSILTTKPFALNILVTSKILSSPL